MTSPIESGSGRATVGVDVKAIAALNRSPVFEHASVRHLRELVASATTVELAPGALLFEEGAPADAFYVLVEGLLQTWTSIVRNGVRTRVLLRQVAPVTALGEADVAFSNARPFTASALRPTRLLRVDFQHFDALLRHATEFRRALRRVEFDAERVRGLTDEADGGSAERILLRCREPELPLSVLVRLLAQTMCAEHGDRVLVLRPRPAATRRISEAVTSGAGRPTVLDVTPEPERLFRGRAWRQLAADHDFVLIDGSALDERGVQAFEPWLDRVVDVFREAVPPASDVRTDFREQAVVLIPHGGFGRPRPEIPVGACRLKLDLTDVRASGGDLDAVHAENRAALDRFARGVTDRTVGLALGGGGAFGYAHVALLRALIERRVPIDVVSGSSFGAVVGAYFTRHGAPGLDRLVDVGAEMRRVTFRSLVDSGFIERFMARETPGFLEDLDTVFLPAVTDVASGHLVVFRGTTIARGVRASGSFPFAFTATVQRHVDGAGRFVDGGIASNVPDQVLLDEGADFLVASNVVPPPRARPSAAPSLPGAVGTWWNEFNPLLRVQDAVRSAFILMHSAGVSDAGLADVLYDTGPLEFLPNDFHRAREIIDRVSADVALAADRVEARWRARSRPERA